MEKIEISYVEYYGDEPVSEQEALNSGSYCKVFSLDGQILKKECFYKHVSDGIYWYTNKLEDVTELLSQLRSEYPKISIILVKREAYLDYIIETNHCFEEDNPVYKGGSSSVYNHLQEEIYKSHFDENDQPDEDDPICKSFYDGIVYYRLYYSENGELNHLIGHWSSDEELNRSEIDLYLPGFIESNPYFANDAMYPDFYSKDSFVLKEKPEPVKKMYYQRLPKNQSFFYRRYTTEIVLSVMLLIILLILFFG